MRSIWLIIKREYLQRIRKKSFLLMTLLGPLFFALLLIIPTWLSLSNLDNQNIILTLDQDGLIEQDFIKEEGIVMRKLPEELSQQEAFIEFSRSNASSLLIVNATENATLYTKSRLSPGIKAWIQNVLNKYFTSSILENKGLTREEINVVSKGFPVKIEQLYNEPGAESQAMAGISILSGIIIYLFILTYTMQVMRGVVEEKTNRVIEVLLTSVSSFRLMLGKILGIGLVSITQFAIWLTVAFIISSAISLRYGESLELFSNENIGETIRTEGINIQQAMEWNQIINTFSGVDLSMLLICFAFYFIFGYLFYSSIFAAVGASVDSETDTQQFVFPLTVPILLCFTMIQTFVTAPESNISLFFSLFPLTSPVAIMILLPYNLPVWVIILSMITLLISFILMVWIAGRIYRIGILMYGKKASLSEMLKWISRS